MIRDEAEVPRYELPDPLVRASGAAVGTIADWRARRREILELFATHVYGTTPATAVTAVPSIVEARGAAFDGTAVRRQERLRLVAGGDEIAVELLSYRPSDTTAPLPLVLAPNFRGNHSVHGDAAIRVPARGDAAERGTRAHQLPLEMLVARGYQVTTFHYGDVTTDDASAHDGALALFHSGDAWGAIGAWAWGMSRVLDHLSQEAHVDRDRILLAGHSRLGKAALWAAAQDERFTAVFANDSGCTGAAIARRRFGETVSAINAQFPHWFCARYHDYAEREHELPVDQHQLIAAIAPRQVYVASAADDFWADPRGEYLGALHASPVYRLLGFDGLTIDAWPPAGAPSTGRIGYHLRPGPHDLLEVDWVRCLEFVERAWRS